MTRSAFYILNTFGAVSFVYFFIIIAYSGMRTSFLWFWPFLGVCCFLYAYVLRACSLSPAGKAAHRLTPFLTALFWLAFVIFFLVECVLLRSSSSEPREDTEYLIILGAQVRGDTPSLSLQARIDTAGEYLKEHPSVKAICSGGQGPGENKTEAQAIFDELVAAGIEPARLALEDTSTTTRENLRFCLDSLPSKDCPVALVTNGFHCYRAGVIAQKTGYTNVSLLPANHFLATTPHYYMREFFALIKEWLLRY